MKLGTGTRWWKFEARITQNVNNAALDRGLTPTLAQVCYASLCQALAEETPEGVAVALRDHIETVTWQIEGMHR